MHCASSARCVRLLHRRHLPTSATSFPPFICPSCLHRAINTTPSLRADDEPTRPPFGREPPRKPLSTVDKMALARDRLLERTRKAIWKGTPPGPDDPYTHTNFPRPGDEGYDEDVVTVGGEYGNSSDEWVDIDELRNNQRQATQEERDRFQQAVDEAPSHREYVPATSWHGLEVVGGEKEWSVGAGEKPRKTFTSFLPPVKVQSPALLAIALHRAAVEVWFAMGEGVSLRRLKETGPRDVEALEGVAHLVNLEPDGPGARLRFPSEEVREDLGAQVRQQELTEEEEDDLEEEEEEDLEAEDTLAAEEAQEEEEAVDSTQPSDNPTTTSPDAATILKDLGTKWHKTPINNPHIKLAISRRLTQLTAHTLPSHLLNTATTLSPLLQHLTTCVRTPDKLFNSLMGTAASPTPRVSISEQETESPAADAANVIGPLPHETFAQKGVLSGLPNVKVSGRRATPIDRHKEVGRWKVIERELREKGLPVVGKGGDGGLLRLRDRRHEYRFTR